MLKLSVELVVIDNNAKTVLNEAPTLVEVIPKSNENKNSKKDIDKKCTLQFKKKEAQCYF